MVQFYFSSTYGGDIILGPAFNTTFLEEVFKLQKQIENVSVKQKVLQVRPWFFLDNCRSGR